MTSNFKAVSELNTLWGNLPNDRRNQDWGRLEAQAKNIYDEYLELMEAIENRDLTEVRDAICDILVFTYGLGHLANVPVDKDMKEVDRSNRSKFAATPEILTQTIKKYTDLGIEVVGQGEFPLVVIRSTKEQTDKLGNVYRANKILKATSFETPVFRPLRLSKSII